MRFKRLGVHASDNPSPKGCKQASDIVQSWILRAAVQQVDRKQTERTKCSAGRWREELARPGPLTHGFTRMLTDSCHYLGVMAAWPPIELGPLKGLLAARQSVFPVAF